MKYTSETNLHQLSAVLVQSNDTAITPLPGNDVAHVESGHICKVWHDTAHCHDNEMRRSLIIRSASVITYVTVFGSR